METIETVSELRQRLGGRRCVLVPTMGALHEGHVSLVKQGKRLGAEHGVALVASVFVNPAQFNDPSDLESYPRPLERDLEALRDAGVDVAFTPTPAEVYPPDQPDAAPQPEVPEVGRQPGLEDRYRPGHFEGVCRVVSRLFDLCDPLASVFGEKDWQQARVIAEMVAQQARDTHVVIGETVRESDGLAMSSRNAHLTPETRGRALGIWRGFEAARQKPSVDAAETAIRREMKAMGFEIEYATIRDAETLMPSMNIQGCEQRMLAAGVLDGVRLLDNAPWVA